MNATSHASSHACSHPQADRARYELRFQSLFNEGRGLAFPCDAQGHVDIDAMGERLRLNYLYARTLIGRDFTVPAVCMGTLQ